MTTIVNLYKSKYDVYIGRPGKGQDGYYGNPYKPNSECIRCGEMHKDNASTLPCYKEYFLNRIKSDESFKANILSLKDKVLGCFCKPKACHGDVIIEWLNENI